MSFDCIIIGAGASGLASLRKFRDDDKLNVHVFDIASDVGGTWFWNRYPGCRCDVPSMDYSFQFDSNLEQEWTWTERYSGQPEIYSYLVHVAERYNLKKDISFNEKVEKATFNEKDNTWIIETYQIHLNKYQTYSCKYLILGTGCLSMVNKPKFKGINTFKGPVYYTGEWPENTCLDNKNVAVIGTGSSGIQVIPMLAEQVSKLTIFQRTANFTVPAHNRLLSSNEIQERKESYKQRRNDCNIQPFALDIGQNMKLFKDHTKEEFLNEVDKRWGEGGFAFLGCCLDFIVNPEAQNIVEDFIKKKIAQQVKDPLKCNLLTPSVSVVCKRLPLDTNYWETYNRDNVHLVSVKDNKIKEITENGIILDDGSSYNFDVIVCATGFDAMTGAITNIDITGKDNRKLSKEWNEIGPCTYLGLCVNGFPNLFTITGPGSPSVFSNMMLSIEQHIDYISNIIKYMAINSYTCIEPEKEAQDQWTEKVSTIASSRIWTIIM